jgi:hypothetical protein
LQDASAAAAHAKDKLIQRQEKLEVVIELVLVPFYELIG